MEISRRQFLTKASCGCIPLPMIEFLCSNLVRAVEADHPTIADQLTMLPAHSVKLEGYLQRYIELSIKNWSAGLVPYKALADFFRTGRPKISVEGRAVELFATGEMWGKAVRSAALFYRYTEDPELKRILKVTVADLLSTRRENGSISCTPIEKQPDGPGGDLWERTYVLLALDDYYEWVERDPLALQAMIDEADATIRQVGPPPKTRIVDLGWSPNHIESSTILEPIMRLYRRTGYSRYLEFARYIVEIEGGAKHHNIFNEVLEDCDPVEVGGVYPKAYEMLSLFEGLVEYYRATGDERWRHASLQLFHKVMEKEITIIGNGGGDQPYHPNVLGEAWDNTALEQTNPAIKRMMETCAGVTWMKFCSQILRLTGDPIAVDYIELYAYNGLIGAMKPSGDGFSYVNLLNGVKTNPIGWGTDVAGVYVTCCNLNGPEGLGYLPLIAVMSDSEGPVLNLYNPGSATIATTDNVRLSIHTNYPLDGDVRIEVNPMKTREFAIKLRIPSWSQSTALTVNGATCAAYQGKYARIERLWSKGDVINLRLDMRTRLVQAHKGSQPGSDQFRALVRGPIVLSRDENIDQRFDQPVDIVATHGFVDVKPMKPTLPATNMQFEVPTLTGTIQMVDYASVNGWTGKRVQTWLRTPTNST